MNDAMTTLGRGTIERDMRRLLPLLTLPWASVGATGDLALTPAGNLKLAPAGGQVLPPEDAAVSLGAEAYPFNALYATDLFVSTLISGGSQVAMDGRLVVAESTTLAADAGAGATSIQVQASILAVNDILCLKAHGNEEWMQVASGPTGGGPYTYGVTRNLDGSGANNWLAGDVVLNTGQSGDGFIELFQTVSLRGTDYGPAMMVWGRNSATWNDIGARARLGNLKGSRGYSANTWGLWAGQYANGYTWLAVDDANGIRIMNYTTQVARWATDGSILIGQVASGQSNVYISSGDLSIRINTTEVFKADRWGAVVAGGASAGHVWITNGDVLIRQATTEKIRIDHTGYIRVGEAGAPNLWLYGSALQMRDASDTTLLDLSAGIITLGAAAGYNLWLDGTAIKLRYQTTNLIRLDGTDGIIVGDTANWHTAITASDIRLKTGATTRLLLDNTYGVIVGEMGAGKSFVQVGAGVVILATGNPGVQKLRLTSDGYVYLTGDLILDTSGVIRSGATAILTGNGYWFEYNGGTPRARVGAVSGGALTAGFYWSGSAFVIAGATSITGSSADDAPVLNVSSSGSGTSSIAVCAYSANYYAVLGDAPNSFGVVGKGGISGVYGFCYGTGGIGVQGNAAVGVSAYGTAYSLVLGGAQMDAGGQNIVNVATLSAANVVAALRNGNAGTAEPTGGSDGDQYIETDALKLWIKIGGAWRYVALT
jgi:hypothetical protein